MKTKILCTLGPSSLSPEVIRGLDERGVALFRINLSHTPPERVAETVELVRRHSSTPICLDTQGAQVRCGPVADDVTLVRGSRVRLAAEGPEGTAESLTLWPGFVFETLQVDSAVAIDFDGVLLRVRSVGDGWADAEVFEGGRVRSNRAVVITPAPALPPVTDDDQESIAIGAKLGITHYALSFASCAADVDLLRTLTPPGSHIISKIESRAGVTNVDEIIETSDAVLVDRGDLSREVPFAYVPFYQKMIVRQANRANRPVYVATNLLESLVTGSRATLAECNDIANTLLDGVHGLVLAAETAIGVDPLKAVDLVRNSIDAFEHVSSSVLLHQERTGSPSWTRAA